MGEIQRTGFAYQPWYYRKDPLIVKSAQALTDVSAFKMETRFCKNKQCGRPFKVNENSAQLYHTDHCKTLESQRKRREGKGHE